MVTYLSTLLFPMGLNAFCSSFLKNPPSKLAVALSGGVDSMVLLHLLSQHFSRLGNVEIHAITIDHKLREESAHEAKLINTIIKPWGVKHTIIPIEQKIPLNQLEKVARFYRYDLLNKYCQSNGISHLFLAHHLDDQLETMGIRLIKNSSFFGLRGMKSTGKMNNLITIRPLLSINKNDIYKYAKDNSIQWVEDPSNKHRDLTLRNELRFHLNNDQLLKSQLLKLNNDVNDLIKSIENSMRELKGEISINLNEQLGCFNIEIPLDVIERYHEIVINRLLFELIESISPDPKYQYKFRKFDSQNTGVINNGFSLIHELLKNNKSGNTNSQLVHCIIRSKIKHDEGKLKLLITRQVEESKNRSVLKTKLNEWIEFDNRFKFKISNNLLKDNHKIVNYNYKLHYNSIKNKGVNNIAKFYQLPVIVNEKNEIKLFPTLDGCEMVISKLLKNENINNN